MTTFSAEVKNEISKLPVENDCCRKAELSALLKTTGTIQIQHPGGFAMKLQTENASIARRIFSLLKDCFDIHTKVMVRKNKQLKKNNNYYLHIDSDMGAEFIMMETGILSEIAGDKNLVWGISHSIIKKNCCKKSYLRGVFLGCGSLSDPEKNYHLELVVSTEEFAHDLKKILSRFDLNAKIVTRKGHLIVYLKEGENIVDFLNIVGAHTALLSLENVRIFKGMRNSVNRLVNCETANLDKTLNASERQIDSINIIKKTIGLRKLGNGLQELAELRELYSEASLKELGEMMSPPIGKSGINHRLRKIEQIAEKIREEGRNE